MRERSILDKWLKKYSISSHNIIHYNSQLATINMHYHVDRLILYKKITKVDTTTHDSNIKYFYYKNSIIKNASYGYILIFNFKIASINKFYYVVCHEKNYY